MRRALAALLLASGCGAPSYQVELRGYSEEVCEVHSERLAEAVEYWNQRGADLCFQGCRVEQYGTDIRSLGDGRLRGLEPEPGVMTLWVGWVIEKPGHDPEEDGKILGIYTGRGCRDSGATVLSAEWNVYAHELGHMMGLGHLDDRTNLMNEKSGARTVETYPWQEERALENLVEKSGLCGTGQRVPACRAP